MTSLCPGDKIFNWEKLLKPYQKAIKYIYIFQLHNFISNKRQINRFSIIWDEFRRIADVNANPISFLFHIFIYFFKSTSNYPFPWPSPWSSQTNRQHNFFLSQMFFFITKSFSSPFSFYHKIYFFTIFCCLQKFVLINLFSLHQTRVKQNKMLPFGAVAP